MSTNIENEEISKLASEVEQLTGETTTDAITLALKERLERKRHQRGANARLGRMRAISERCAELLGGAGPPVDHADLLYNERGLPK